MTTDQEGRDDALQSALRVAQENEDRWIGLYAECSGSCEGAERWAETARLRRREIVRIDQLLAGYVEGRLPGMTFGNPPHLRSHTRGQDRQVSTRHSAYCRVDLQRARIELQEHQPTCNFASMNPYGTCQCVGEPWQKCRHRFGLYTSDDRLGQAYSHEFRFEQR